MLIGINKVRVGVLDQERAKRFWTETLGCEIVQDESYGDERWLEVRLPDGVVLVLEKCDAINEAASPGQPNTSVFLACDDVDASRELAARRVTFAQEPVDMPCSRWSLFEDSEGNRFPLTTKA